MTENIQLDGANILNDYKPGNNLDEDKQTDEETHGALLKKGITINLPELKGPEFYETLNKIKQWKSKFPDECKDIDIKNENNLHMRKFSIDLNNAKLPCPVAPMRRYINLVLNLDLV